MVDAWLKDVERLQISSAGYHPTWWKSTGCQLWPNCWFQIPIRFQSCLDSYLGRSVDMTDMFGIEMIKWTWSPPKKGSFVASGYHQLEHFGLMPFVDSFGVLAKVCHVCVLFPTINHLWLWIKRRIPPLILNIAKSYQPSSTIASDHQPSTSDRELAGVSFARTICIAWESKRIKSQELSPGISWGFAATAAKLQYQVMLETWSKLESSAMACNVAWLTALWSITIGLCHPDPKLPVTNL